MNSEKLLLQIKKDLTPLDIGKIIVLPCKGDPRVLQNEVSFAIMGENEGIIQYIVTVEKLNNKTNGKL